MERIPLQLDLLGQLAHRLDNHPQQEEEDHHERPDWDIVKTLTMSDVDRHQCRVVLPRDRLATVFPKWDSFKVAMIKDGGLRVQVLVKDVDTGFSPHWVVFHRCKSNGLFQFQSGWVPHFVVRRHLKEGDAIQLCWDPKQLCFLFSVRK